MFRRRFFLTMLLVLAGVAALGWKTGGEGRSLMPELSVSGAAGSLWSGARSSLANAWDWAFGGSEDGSGWAAPDAGPWAGYQTTPAPPTWSAPSYGAPAPNPAPNPAANPAALQTAAPAACLGDPRGAAMGGPFSLVGPNGRRVTSDSLKGQPLLIYFGFTYCPAICPTELQKLTKAHAKLPKATQDKVQLYFVTIDSDRDTAEILKNYMGLFDDKWVGLRGNNAQTETIKRAYKIYAAKVPVGNDDYTMDHSSFVYLIAPDGTLAHLFKGTDSVEFITKTLSEIIK